jgi:hypothetical protein
VKALIRDDLVEQNEDEGANDFLPDAVPGVLRSA